MYYNFEFLLSELFFGVVIVEQQLQKNRTFQKAYAVHILIIKRLHNS